VRSFCACATLLALFVATTNAGLEGDLALGLERNAALVVAGVEGAGELSQRDCPIPEAPAPADEPDDDDDAAAAPARNSAAPTVSGEIVFYLRDLQAASEMAERLFRPPIA